MGALDRLALHANINRRSPKRVSLQETRQLEAQHRDDGRGHVHEQYSYRGYDEQRNITTCDPLGDSAVFLWRRKRSAVTHI